VKQQTQAQKLAAILESIHRMEAHLMSLDSSIADAITAQADAMDAEVVGRISPLTDAVKRMDATLQPIVPPTPPGTP
jgi:hypothetical protein